MIFIEVSEYLKKEEQPKKDELEKVQFELQDEDSASKYESTEEDEVAEEEEPQNPVLRRSARERRQPERYSPYDFHSAFTLSVTDDDPRTVIEALDSKEGKFWKKAMDEEMAALEKNKTWNLVKLPARRKPVGNKWVFKKKFSAKSKVEKYKARLVAKGYSQVEGIDFGDIFSLVVKITSIRFILVVATAFDLEIE